MSARLHVRRFLTATPLAQEHERRLFGKQQRRPRAIPWTACDRSSFPKPALDLAVDSYVKLAAGEYGAVQLYGALTSAMALAGLPLDLITASAAICTDEARHADYAMQMTRVLTGEDVPIPLDKESLERPWKKDVTTVDIDVVVLHVAAIPGHRYFSFEFMDPYTNVFHYIGTRTTGDGAPCTTAMRFCVAVTTGPPSSVRIGLSPSRPGATRRRP